MSNKDNDTVKKKKDIIPLEEILDNDTVDLAKVSNNDNEDAQWEDLDGLRENVGKLIAQSSSEVALLLQNPVVAKAIQDKEEAIKELNAINNIIQSLHESFMSIYKKHKDKKGKVDSVDDVMLLASCGMEYQGLSEVISTTLFPAIINLNTIVIDSLKSTKEEEDGEGQ